MRILDRRTGAIFEEKVYGEKAVEWIHGASLWQRMLCALACRWPFFSWVYGAWQKLPHTRAKIAPFIKNYQVNPAEFAEPVESFSSFNDFFVRALKKEARPISAQAACMPADARATFFETVEEASTFWIKGSEWDLRALLGSEELAERFAGGAAMVARLAPPDYHRFHFPVSGYAKKPFLVGKALYSVNPISLRKNPRVFTENKRFITPIETEEFGTVLMIEVGATNVGSILQTATFPAHVKKGEEKGYFSFGASAIVLLFEKNRCLFEPDLVEATRRGFELYCRMGEPLATPRLG